VKYVILIHSNPTSRHVFDGLTEQQQLDFANGHRSFGQSLIDAGVLVTSEGLVPAEHARWVTVKDGEILATDGPYAETKEYLAGFYVVECADIDEAIRHAARVPDAAYNQVEVRPVFDWSMLDG
jgi:hypothetical protein